MIRDAVSTAWTGEDGVFASVLEIESSESVDNRRLFLGASCGIFSSRSRTLLEFDKELLYDTDEEVEDLEASRTETGMIVGLVGR